MSCLWITFCNLCTMCKCSYIQALVLHCGIVKYKLSKNTKVNFIRLEVRVYQRQRQKLGEALCELVTQLTYQVMSSAPHSLLVFMINGFVFALYLSWCLSCVIKLTYQVMSSAPHSPPVFVKVVPSEKRKTPSSSLDGIYMNLK